MSKEPKFYICDVCKNITLMVEDNGPKLHCCGKAMNELVANTTEAATEKHIPQVKVEGHNVYVEVGSVAHPMLKEHHIGWIFLVTNKGVQYKYLELDKGPKAEFVLGEGESVVSVYEYCNLHGLWKA